MIHILNIEPEHWGLEARNLLRSFADLTEERPSRERLIQIIPDYEVLLVKLDHQIDEEILQKAHKLKAIVSPTTGLDHIDLASAKKKGIAVLSLNGHVDFLNNITATAEHTWALLLSLIRKIPQASQDVRNGNWRRDIYRGIELNGKNIGIIGYGRLGRMVADYAGAFRMKIHVCDPHVSRPSGNDIKWLPLDQLLKISDVITLHVPLSEETKFLIDRGQFSLMKSHTVLINTSRGGIVNEEALLEALSKRKIAGASLDVLAGEEEFRKKNSRWPALDPLIEYAKNHDNLILTPHVGGATADSIGATEIYVANQLKNYLGYDNPVRPAL